MAAMAIFGRMPLPHQPELLNSFSGMVAYM
jgi:hypothetical protein